MKINIPVSCGELVDKITILKIKKIKIIDEDKLREINKELEYLNMLHGWIQDEHSRVFHSNKLLFRKTRPYLHTNI